MKLADKQRWSAAIALGSVMAFALAIAILFGNAQLAKGQSPIKATRRPPVTALAVSPDGKHLLAGGQFGVEVYRLNPAESADSSPLEVSQLGEPASRIDVQLTNVHAIVFSPQGDHIAIGGGTPGDGGSVEIYSWPDTKLVLRAQPHTDLIYAIAWSPDGSQLATGSYDRDVKILNAADGSEARTLAGHSRPVLAAQWLSDGTTLTTAGVDRSLRVWKAASGELTRSSENHTQTINALAERPQADTNARPMIVSAGADKTIRFWQPTIGRLVRFARLESIPLDVAWSSNGDQVIAACEDGALRGTDPDTAAVEVLGQISSTRLECLAVVAVGDDDASEVFAGDSEGQIWRARVPATK